LSQHQLSWSGFASHVKRQGLLNRLLVYRKTAIFSSDFQQSINLLFSDIDTFNRQNYARRDFLRFVSGDLELDALAIQVIVDRTESGLIRSDRLFHARQFSAGCLMTFLKFLYPGAGSGCFLLHACKLAA